ncbi:MAG TPA: glycosyltransferase [Terriglobales bacterium]|nr:glycosyltransferase [Terriglobales bacterium]
MHSVDFTVAICTYKRPAMLHGVLESLEHQKGYGKVSWEVLVVDNDPCRSAKRVADQFALNKVLPLRYIHERKVGLSHARNCAVRESRGAIIAFLDDDVLVPPHWLAEMAHIFERTNADCVGGRVLVKWDEPPEAPVRACEKELVAFDKGNLDYPFEKRSVPIGANLAIRTDVFDRESTFVCSLGRSHKTMLGGEEVELLFRLLKHGRQVWYSSGAYVMHRMAGERVKTDYYVRREYWNGVSLAVIDRLHNTPLYCHLKAWVRLAQLVVALLPCSMWAWVNRDIGAQFLNICRRQKYFAYWCETMGIAKRQ